LLSARNLRHVRHQQEPGAHDTNSNAQCDNCSCSCRNYAQMKLALHNPLQRTLSRPVVCQAGGILLNSHQPRDMLCTCTRLSLLRYPRISWFLPHSSISLVHYASRPDIDSEHVAQVQLLHRRGDDSCNHPTSRRMYLSYLACFRRQKCERRTGGQAGGRASGRAGRRLGRQESG